MQEALNDSSNMTGLGMLFLAAMAVLTFSLPRKQAVLPLLTTVCYMPLGQQLVIAGLHFHVLRLVILFGVMRVVCRGEHVGLVFNKIDKLFLWWAVAGVITGMVCKPSSEMLVNRLGVLYNAVGIYFLVSCWLKDSEAFVDLVKTLALLVIPIATSMVVEKVTARNIFHVFGGVPEVTIAREGHLRCQAAFQHPILAGTFGATLFPLFVGLWFQGGKARTLGLLGGVSASIIALAASSSGALLALLLGGVGFTFWKLRDRMRLVRRGILVLVLVLAIVMEAPVWYLAARLGSITGGQGWHRAWLIDVTIAHFGEWCLAGTTYTAHWGPSQICNEDPNNIDITNQFVAEGVRGGVVKLALYIAIIVQCFKTVGRAVQARTTNSLAGGMLCWAMGVTLFAHCVSFWSVAYYDQLTVVYFWLLAAISRTLWDPAEDPALSVTQVGMEFATDGSRQ
jgi:hypothetical protein